MRIITLLLIFTTNCLHANPDSLKAIQLFEQLVIEIELEYFDEVDQKAQKGLTVFKDQDNLVQWLRWNIKIGDAFRKVEKYEKALEYLEKATALTWREAKSNKELNLLAYAYRKISNLYNEDLNAQRPALTYFEQYKTICKDRWHRSDDYMARYVYNKLGTIYYALRDEEKAVYYFEQAKQISKRERNWKLYVLSCHNLGDLYKSLDKYNMAEEAYNEALKWKDSIGVKDRGILYNVIGLYNYHIDNFSKSRDYTNSAKALFDEESRSFTNKEQAKHLYDFYFNYGRINKGEKKYQEAESFYNKALQLLETDLKDGNRRQQAVMQINFGHLYFDQNQLDKAEKHFRKSIAYSSSVLSEYNDPYMIPVNALIGEDLVGYAYEMLGRVAMSKYREEQNLNELQNAVRYFELADLVDQIRLESYATEQSSLTSLSSQRELKEEIQLALYELWQRNQQYSTLEKMFAFSEKSRSLLLLEKNKEDKAVSTWDKETQKNYYLKKAKLQQLEEEIYSLKTTSSSNNTDTLNFLRGQFLALNDELAELQRIKNKTAKFKFSKPSAIKVIQQNLTKDQALLEFFVGEDYIFTYAISKQDLKVYKKPKSNNFFQVVDSLRSNLVAHSDRPKAFGENAFYLYDVLLQNALEELPKKVNRLVMVKDQILNFIPFEVFLTHPYEEGMHYFNMPYLIRKYSVSSASSATLFAMQQQTAQGRAPQEFAGYAPSYDVKDIAQNDTTEQRLLSELVRSGDYELRGAKKEVNSIAEYLEGASFFGDEASEAHFKENAENYRILLLSMHGLVNEDNPHFSELRFTSGASGENDDDVLRPIELRDMKLKADIAVLSACETGYGKLYPGEGVFSFSRAFFMADVPSTVMSLWKVNDQSTGEIMGEFFKNLKKGYSKDKALQLAKLDYFMANENNRFAGHPYYWAGMSVCGNTDGLGWLKNNYFWKWAIPFLVLFGLLFYMRKQS